MISENKSNTDIIISENLKDLFNNLINELTDLTGKNDIGLSLVIFNHKNNSRLNYISNCKRNEVIKVWLTLINGWEKGMPDIPAHEYQS